MTEQHALSRLIESAKEANSWNNSDLARAARQHGHSVSRSNISRILTDPVKTVVPSQVRMLAAATGLPVEMVTLAAVKATGLSVADSAGDLATQVRNDPDLPVEVKRAILEIIAPYKKRRTKSTVTNLSDRRSPFDPAVSPPVPNDLRPDEYYDNDGNVQRLPDEVAAARARFDADLTAGHLPPPEELAARTTNCDRLVDERSMIDQELDEAGEESQDHGDD